MGLIPGFSPARAGFLSATHLDAGLDIPYRRFPASELFPLLSLRAGSILCRYRRYVRPAHVVGAAEEVGVRKGAYFLLELDVTAQRTKVTSYSYDDREKAQEEYSKAERSAQSQDVVLVSAENIKASEASSGNLPKVGSE